MNAPLWAALLTTVLAAALYLGNQMELWPLPGLDELERSSLDARFRLRGPQKPGRNDIVIVGLDDKTRTQAVELFQTRRGLSRLIRALEGYKPRAVGLDMLFSSPEVSLDPEVVSRVKEAYQALSDETERSPAASQALDALGAVVDETRGDEELAQAVADAENLFLGLVFHLPDQGQQPAPAGIREPEALAPARFGEWVSGSTSQRPPAAYAVSRSMNAVARGAKGAGALNVIPDPDGNVRRVHGVIEYGGRYYMPLGLAMVARMLDKDTSYVAGDQVIRMGERTLPVSRRGEMMLAHLGGSQTFPHVSAADVLTGTAPAEALAGKLVFVGYTDAARDKVSTPLDPRLDGVEIHATLAHNILEGELLRRTGPAATLLTLLLLGGAITALQLRRIRKRRAWVAGTTALVIVAGYLIVAHILFSDRGLVVEVAAPVLACVAVTLTSLIAALATEGREKAQLRAAFSQYVSDAVVEQILTDPSLASLGGERRDLTVLFSDIRGFSSFSEKLQPEVLSAYLNEYLTPMTELVMDDGGMLDKYIGDAVMAVYGAPIELSDHAERACRTALAMLEALAPLNEHWRGRGLPDIAIGIGISSGPMAVGNMGSEARFSYTVLGDTVNLGARLEGLTKEYRVNILVAEDTVAHAGKGFVFRELDWVRVKGRAGTSRIYELLGELASEPASEFSGKPAGRAGGAAVPDSEELSLFARALDAYRNRDWDRAEEDFARFLAKRPEDGPAQVMRERVRALRANPPGADWDGVFDQVSK